MSDHRIEADDRVPGARRIHWWFVCSSALIILLFMGWAFGVALFAARTNDRDGLNALMLVLCTTMLLYPLMPAYAEIVQDRRRR